MLSFTPQDLAANKLGQLTLSQREKLKNLSFSQKKMMHFAGLALATLWYIPLILLFLYGSLREDIASTGQPALVWFVALTGPLWMGLISYFIGQSLNKKLAQVLVCKRVTGPAGKKELTSEDGIGYEIEINGVKFNVEEEFFNSIQVGEHYGFYYVPNININMIVSWEKFKS